MTRSKSIAANLDWVLFIVFLIMLAMGVANIYSVSYKGVTLSNFSSASAACSAANTFIPAYKNE